MEASEAQVQKVLEGNKQFLVPHFQRPYAWREEQWRALWNDVLERTDESDPTPHFLGPIVTAPARSVPEGVEKRLLIDGQQRLTSIVVLLTAIRDEARRTGADKIAERIQDLITNRHEDGADRFKVLPTQGESIEESDRAALSALVDGTTTLSKSAILDAKRFFDKRVRAHTEGSLEQLFGALARKVTLVSIILGERDNPYRIFESLNGKGRPLTQGDLIRNFFFMRIAQGQHEQVYTELWRPMQKRLGEDALTDFIRHDLMAATGTVVRETDVYAALKDRVERAGDPVKHLARLAEYAGYYEVLLHPERARSPGLRARLDRIARLEVTVAFPLLLPAYAEYEQGRLGEGELCRLLDVVETYVLRRFVCGVPTYGLNKTFAPLFTQSAPVDAGFVQRIADALARKDCPRDAQFRDRLQSARLYGQGERRDKVKLILERLEAMAGHKEVLDPRPLTIEHVMPQTITPEWVTELGADAEDTHDDLLHTLGNLTLTGYNAELGNLAFATKRQRYAESHVELNAWFVGVERWSRGEIERRAAALTEQALQAWPWFGPPIVETGPSEEEADDGEDVTGTVPRELVVRGQTYAVRSWADVAKGVAAVLVDLGDEVFDRVSGEMPRFVNRDATSFRKTSKLGRLANGGYVETNLSAKAIHRWSRQALELAGIPRSEWSVAYAGAGGGEDEERGGSELAALQLEFWTEARKSLVASGAFPSLRNPPDYNWFVIGLGRSGFALELIVSFRERRVGAKILIDGPRVEKGLPQLTAQRGEIEKELGFAPDWDPYPEKKQRTIVVWRGVDVNERENWAPAIDVLTGLAVKMYGAFAPRVGRLEL